MFNPKFASVKHGQATPYWAGNDGRQALGNIDSPEWIQMFKYMYQAWQEELVPIGEVAQGLGTDPFLLNQQGFKDLGAYGSYVDAIEQGINARVVQKPCIGPDKGITGLGGWTTPWTIFKATSVPQAAQDWVYYLGTDGAIAFTKYEGNSEPPALKKLAEDHSLWARSEEDAQTVLHIVDNAPPLVFTPNFRPIYEPMVVAWTRITEEGVDVETAIHEAAVEVQELLDDAWEQWDALAA